MDRNCGIMRKNNRGDEMLTLLLGTDWVANREYVLKEIAQDVARKKGGRILMVPELISHDTERRLCATAGDTSSRFAEVLTFTRLARRISDAVGHGAQECLDDGGRVVAMASAARQLHSKLKAYASVETKPEFLTGLVDAVDEFKRCCITSQDLKNAADQSEGAFAQKLEELSLILESYDSLCARGKRDPRDQMTWVLEQLEDSSFAKEHVFYIDGFPDFTRQHMAILAHIIENSQKVVVSLNCDTQNSSRLAFEKAGTTAADFIRCAEKVGVPVEIVHVEPRQNELSVISDCLFQGKIQYAPQLADVFHVYRSETVYTECTLVAEKIMDLVQSGTRFRDISVVCADMSAYCNVLPMVFGRCKIPCYVSGTEDILEKPVITTVLSALDAALGGFEQKSVLVYLKSMLSPLELSMCDRVENYAIIWNISGKRWLQEWNNHPAGLGEQWTDASQQELAQLNAARRQALEPISQLADGFKNAKNLKEQVQVLYRFLENIQLAERLSDLAQQMDASGDNRNAQILNQLWEILLSALEQLHDVLGETAWDAETFTRLLKLLLSQYDVGTIPPVLDTVTVGPVSAMRCQQAKHLFVMGALEGAFPGYGGSTGVLTDQERVALRGMGVPLTGGSVDGLQAEFAEIYGVFCGAETSVSVSCPAGQPSFVYRRLSELAGGEQAETVTLGAARADENEAAAFLSRNHGESFAEDLGLTEAVSRLEQCKNYALGSVCRSSIEKLYGKQLYLSASQIDRQAECRLSYFLKYGLRAKERKVVTVDPAEFGTYVHAVLENTGREIMKLGGFQAVSLDKIQSIAEKYSDEYAADRFREIDSERLSYLFRRNSQELKMVVEELWREMQESSFEPVNFEVGFGSGEQLDAIPVPGKTMNAMLRGFVDRVDVWQENGQNYYRVVDYKTGKKDFDYCDVFNGIGLQMLLYMFALQQIGGQLLGENPVPAGVQYFPARAPMMPADGVLTEEEAEQERQKLWKRKGLLLEDAQVLSAMEPGDNPTRMCYKRKKDGTLSGDLADRQQFKILKKYVFHLLETMVDDIASGCVDPNPYTRGNSHNACTFCPYGEICHPSEVAGRRDYQTMSAQKFWEEIEKEMTKLG